MVRCRPLVSLLPLFMFCCLTGCGGENSLVQPGSGDGLVFINSYPDDPGFPWRLTMPGGLVLTGQGDSTLVDMPEGGYSINWGPVDQWYLPYPNPYHLQLEYPLAITFTGIYTPFSYNYPRVPGVEVRHGQEPGQIEVNWLWYLSADHATHHYEVGMNTSGPVTDENWLDSNAISQQLHDSNRVGYTEVFGEADGLVPGQEAWFGVRAVDSDGWTTNVVESPSLIVSSAWWATGMVTDIFGLPLTGVVVGSEQVEGPVITGSDGAYTLGPLLDQEDVVIWSDAGGLDPLPSTDGWYNFRSPAIRSQGDSQLDIMVIPRFGMDSTCSTYEGDFLNYLRYMTKTNTPSLERPNQLLCSWLDYPVKVYVPDHVRPDGVDFGENCRQGIALWNLAVGQEILISTGVAESEADVVFSFSDLGSMINGVTSLAEPQGFEGYLGYVVPERIDVGINNVVLPTDQRVQETCLHEMGHALGLYRHVQFCTQAGYLMSITSAGVLDDGPENAVHQDEVRAMQIIRSLPRWMDLSGFH